MLPIVHGLEKEYGDRIAFFRINILNPENEALLEKFGFSTTPELYLLDAQDQVIGFWHEDVAEDTLRQAFENALK